MASVLEQPQPPHNGVTPNHTNHTPSLDSSELDAPSKNQPQPQQTTKEEETNSTMVAGIYSTSASGTPPESPHRINSLRNPFSMPPAGKSPQHHHQSSSSSSQNRRATYAGESLSPARAVKPGVGITGGANNGGGVGSLTNSPIPPRSDRFQPASATAPVVGRHHKKNNSLVGFDPLLNTALTMDNPNNNNNGNNNFVDSSSHNNHAARETPLAAPRTPVTPVRSPVRPTSKDKSGATPTAAVASALSNLTLPPPSPPKTAEPELSNELRKLAKDLSAASPHRPASTKVSKPIFGRATSLTPKFTLTPPFRSNDKTTTPTIKEPLSAPAHRSKLPWQRHRRSRSLETPEVASQAAAAAAAAVDITLRSESFENDSSSNHNKTSTMIDINNRRSSTSAMASSHMMQDLYDVVTAQAKQDSAGMAISNLALPSLAKPAATSFLTGKEIVRSSEQDPSPFQMEIPSLEQTLVAARLVQFVEVYRKEDLNLDLNMSLVGVNRSQLHNFVSPDTNSPPPPQQLANLTDAHRPLVESLIEAADDVTVAGFFATENAGSADVRREAVVLERQMQFVVVFRGTTPEQQAKSAFFKKHNKQNALETLEGDVANADCKVYSAVKQAYMELEHRVFDCLDKYLDENPFCDVVFTGSSMGGSMATLAAFRYATNRPMVRVCSQTFGSPKAGNRVFRQQANSLPNLKVMRVEYASDPKCFAPPADANGAHVGHSIVLSKKSETNNALTAAAYKFDDNHDSRKHQPSKPNIFVAAFKKERDITSYASSLEQMYPSKHKWVTDFQGEDGTGVRGKDNEQRQVV